MGGGWGSDWNSKAYQLGIRVSRDRVEEAMEVDHRSAPVGALPRAHGGKGRCMRRALPFACHSLMALCFYRVQASPMSTSGCGLLTLVSSWSTAVPFPGLLSKPRIPAASSSHPPESPQNCAGGHPFKAGAHRAVAGTICAGLALSCCILLCILCCIFLTPKSPLLCHLTSLLVRGLPRTQEPLLT